MLQFENRRVVEGGGRGGGEGNGSQLSDPGLFGFIGFDVDAFGDVAVGGGGTEAALAVRALDVVGRVGRRRRRKIRYLAAILQVFLHLLGGADGLDERLVLLAPVSFLGAALQRHRDTMALVSTSQFFNFQFQKMYFAIVIIVLLGRFSMPGIPRTEFNELDVIID